MKLLSLLYSNTQYFTEIKNINEFKAERTENCLPKFFRERYSRNSKLAVSGRVNICLLSAALGKRSSRAVAGLGH